MRKYSDSEIELINIQIGCLLRLARLRKGLSQLDLGHQIDSNSTLIGRIERAEGKTGWEKIYMLSKQLGINFNELFELKDKEALIAIVKESLRYEDKLTQEKKKYYTLLITRIELKYKQLP
ncbi:XRE family transcriptional regulator [Euzebyella marina]|uniref:XRE family transcriptional regulator n=1 Tax=Euzebyella marina TaxID=1761453 RepID=A0A3G2L5P2_9FLAO|nr:MULTISPECIES: helix-turn-helix transcriptional regulator [Bacteroidota]AYN67526.1 XRE family transcriptional regulator [Euzebyella marina]MBC7000473.1 helix-turn-helix transcriptional regulator [Cytophaga sp. FL35]